MQNAGTGYANLEYCDMTRRCCNGTGGWMRVANLDMTDTNHYCPSGFRLITSPRGPVALQGGDVCPECAERSKGTSTTVLMHLDHTIIIHSTQLIISMLMELVSLMDKDQGNISGPLQLLMMKQCQPNLCVPVLRLILHFVEDSHHS